MKTPSNDKRVANHQFVNRSIYPSSLSRLQLKNNSISPIITLVLLLIFTEFPWHFPTPPLLQLCWDEELFTYTIARPPYLTLCNTIGTSSSSALSINYANPETIRHHDLIHSHFCWIEEMLPQLRPSHNWRWTSGHGEALCQQRSPVLYAARNKLNTSQSSHYHSSNIVECLDRSYLSPFVSRKKPIDVFMYYWPTTIPVDLRCVSGGGFVMYKLTSMCHSKWSHLAGSVFWTCCLWSC